MLVMFACSHDFEETQSKVGKRTAAARKYQRVPQYTPVLPKPRVKGGNVNIKDWSDKKLFPGQLFQQFHGRSEACNVFVHARLRNISCPRGCPASPD